MTQDSKKKEEVDDDPATEAKRKGHYFNNHAVEQLLTEYVKGGCTDVDLRDSIMKNASELIRQIIRTHNLHEIYPGRDNSSFMDLYQVAWCVAPDSYLFTDNGMEKIGDLIPKGFGECDLKVFGHNGLKEAVKYIRRPVTKVLNITTKYGYNLSLTPEHPVLSLHNGSDEWVKAGNLKNGDLIAVQRNQKCFGSDRIIDFAPLTAGDTTHMWNPPETYTQELAYIIGLIVSKGSIEDNRIIIYNTSEEVWENVRRSDVPASLESKGRIVINCKGFVEFIKWLDVGQRVWDKKIPSELLKCTEIVIVAFLRGMFDGDGHSNFRNGHVGYTSTSKMLIDQLRLLLLNFGIITKTALSDRKYSQTPKKFGGYKESTVRPCYQLLLPTIDSYNFYDKVGFSIDYKQSKRKSLSNRPCRHLPHMILDKIIEVASNVSNFSIQKRSGVQMHHLQTQRTITESTFRRLMNLDEFKFNNYLHKRLDEIDNITWLPITKIYEEESEVINIEVPNDSTFTANGIVTHNCQIESTLYKFDWRPGHTKVFNMWSQVAKTVILAYIKKETRDRKNYGSYKKHLYNKPRKEPTQVERFVNEARAVCKENQDFKKAINALEQLYEEDERPFDGIIGKLMRTSGLSRSKVAVFLKFIRDNKDKFSDLPTPEPDITSLEVLNCRRKRYNSDFEEEDD